MTVELSGTSFVTTAPAPILQLEPIVIPGRIIAPEPISHLSPIFTYPKRLDDGAISQKLPIQTS